MFAEAYCRRDRVETPGINTLDIIYLADSQVSVASPASFLRMCTNPQYYLQNGRARDVALCH